MKKLKSIKSGVIRRNASLLKYALKTGRGVLKNQDDPGKILDAIIGNVPQKFVDELSAFKGSLTKAGQLISQYGEYYLSEEVMNKLRLLQSSTHYLDFQKIQAQLTPKAVKDFNIDPEPLAAASIGQVHCASLKSAAHTDKKYVFKIQYKGIEKAISTDMKFLKIFLNGAKVIPKGIDATDIYLEIESVLRKEMDYTREANIIQKFSNILSDDFFIVPTVEISYTNKTSICMSYHEGIHLNEIEKTADNKAQRDLIGKKIYELFLKEIFHFGMVQTDAHGGNYLVHEDLNAVVLLDFGACLEFPDIVLDFYRKFILYSYEENRDKFFDTFEHFQSYSGKKLKYDEDIMWEYIRLLSAPMRSVDYDWGKSTLPDQLMEKGEELRASLEFKSIPSDFIFLDRKIMGIFTLLRSLESQFNVKELIDKNCYRNNLF